MLASYSGVGRNLYTTGPMHVSGGIGMWDWESVKLVMSIDDWQQGIHLFEWPANPNL